MKKIATCFAVAALSGLPVGGVQGADLGGSAAVVADEWPQFRGPTGQGIATDAPLVWSETEGIAWKTPLPGRGWSSPVVADGQIWLTTAIEQPATAEQMAKLKAASAGKPGGDALKTVGAIDLVALTLDAATGELLREATLFHIDDPQPIHGLNSYASPTPVLAEGRCYCHFGTWGTACIDCRSGEVVWKKTLAIDHMVGPGSSPALFGKLLIIPCDGGDRQFVAALDVATGDVVWETQRPGQRTDDPDLKKAFCTPLVIRVGEQDQVVIPGAQWFIAYDPASGRELWRVDHGDGFSNVPRPVFDGELVFMCTGFGRTEILAVRPDGAGDVTASHIAWRLAGQIPTQPSPALANGRVSIVSDQGVATALDAATGKQIWRKRLGGNFSSSPLVVGERIYFSSRDGDTTVISAGDEFKVLAKNHLDGGIMASPAVYAGDLIMRTDAALYRISGEGGVD